MTDQALGHDEQPASFTVVPTAIPAGVRCGRCGRLHLPRRLHPVNGCDAANVVTLRCQRCDTTGPLVIDPDDPAHVEILSALAEGGSRPTR